MTKQEKTKLLAHLKRVIKNLYIANELKEMYERDGDTERQEARTEERNGIINIYLEVSSICDDLGISQKEQDETLRTAYIEREAEKEQEMKELEQDILSI